MDKKVILHSLSETSENYVNQFSNATHGSSSNSSASQSPEPAAYITRGIDNSGALIVEDNAGTMHTISSDEISVRGLLGYI